MTKLCWLNTTYACGGIILNDKNTIIQTCPIYKWMRGKFIGKVLDYLYSKGTFLELACYEEEA